MNESIGGVNLGPQKLRLRRQQTTRQQFTSVLRQKSSLLHIQISIAITGGVGARSRDAY
jgi:hypothetical protein